MHTKKSQHGKEDTHGHTYTLMVALMASLPPHLTLRLLGFQLVSVISPGSSPFWFGPYGWLPASCVVKEAIDDVLSD